MNNCLFQRYQIKNTVQKRSFFRIDLADKPIK